MLEAKEDLAQLKKEKAGLLRATYAAVRGEGTPVPDDLAVLGKDGPFRVRSPRFACKHAAVVGMDACAFRPVPWLIQKSV